MKIDEILKKKIKELTDFDPENLNQDTLIEDIGFDSLDFLSVQVTIQREMHFTLDLNRIIADDMPKKYGEFLNSIETQYKESIS